MRLLCATVLSILNRLRSPLERRGGSDAVRSNENADVQKEDDAEEEEEASGEEADGQEEADIKEAIVEGYPQALLEHRLTPRILTAAALCLGWGYGEGYPWPWGAAPLSLLRPLGYGGKTNCSTFAAHVQFGLYPDVEWTEEHYRELMVWDASAPWSALDPVVELGKGRRVSLPNDKQWHLAQSWSTAKSGHTYLFFADGDDLYILESNVGVGPQWRVTTWPELVDGRDVRLVRLD